MARVLITGASGFIGSHIARACLSRGDEVHVVLRRSSCLCRLSGISTGIGVHRVSYDSTEALKAILELTKPEIIFHSAARTRFPAKTDLGDLADSVNDNLLPLVNILCAATNCGAPPRVLVRLGSIAEYGETDAPSVETCRERPLDTYGVSMLAGTRYLETARSRLPFHAVTARLSLTYGPGQSLDFLVPRLIDCFLKQKPVVIKRPQDRRDLIHVDDVVRALLLIADDPATSDPVMNVSTGYAPEMSEVAKMLMSITEAPEKLLELDPTGQEPVTRNANPALMTARYGWVPEIPLREGLERMVRHARKTLGSEGDTQLEVS